MHVPTFIPAYLSAALYGDVTVSGMLEERTGAQPTGHVLPPHTRQTPRSYHSRQAGRSILSH